MTTIREYVKLGIDRETLIRALEESAETRNAEKGKRYHVGIPNRTYFEPDGTPFGRQVLRAGDPVMLKECVDRFGIAVLYERESGLLWGTANGNVTLDPRECNKILAIDREEQPSR